MVKYVLSAIGGLLLAFWAGWVGCDWKRDSDQLVIERAAAVAGNAATTQALAASGDSARRLETKLEELKGVLPASIRTEVVKPVFINVCLSDEFVGMYNEAVDKAERALSGKPENKMLR